MLAQSISVILVVHFLKKFQIIAFRRIVECRGGFRVSFDIETSHCTEKTDGKPQQVRWWIGLSMRKRKGTRWCYSVWDRGDSITEFLKLGRYFANCSCFHFFAICRIAKLMLSLPFEQADAVSLMVACGSNAFSSEGVKSSWADLGKKSLLG